jgi:hypothetical protein
MVRVLAVGVVAVVVVAAVGSPAYAVKEFFVELEAKYVKPNSKKRPDLTLRAAIEQASCTICHPGDDKHKLSEYGGKVAYRINKFDKNNKKKIQAAFEEVGGLRSDAYDAKSPTYNQLFRQGKLPPTFDR